MMFPAINLRSFRSGISRKPLRRPSTKFSNLWPPVRPEPTLRDTGILCFAAWEKTPISMENSGSKKNGFWVNLGHDLRVEKIFKP